MVAAEGAVTALILIGGLIGLAFAAFYAYQTSLVSITELDMDSSVHAPLNPSSETAHAHEEANWPEIFKQVQIITSAISVGAKAFLFAEYKYIGAFVVLFSILLLVLLGTIHSWTSGIFTALAFVIGAVTSIACGYIGMMIAVFSNGRTAIQAYKGYGPAFVTAFKAGCVMGFALVSLGLLVLFVVIKFFAMKWTNVLENVDDATTMFECIAGYGLGGSAVALFGRVGGGIYTKAADVGADLVGKVEQNLPEDDPRNPACIADNVGDNVGDIAGMGADLFGSFAESACAAMVIAAQSGANGAIVGLHESWGSLLFPLCLSSAGILVSILTSFVATHLLVVSNEREIEPSLKRQILVSTVLMTPTAYLLCLAFLPSEFSLGTLETGFMTVKYWHVFVCVAAGLWSGLIIGYVTEYYTSHSYQPVRDVANSCSTGAATNVIYGLALGYKSCIVPVFCLAATIYTGYSLAKMFGVACGALGILSTLSIALTIDAYGPICDNAGGIAEMAHMPEQTRERTDALDGAGNTTAAIGKGFAIGSAALVSLALFGAYVTTAGLDDVDILRPFQFAGLLVGSMLPYWFSALTMKSVGMAALEMVTEVRRQIAERPGILARTELPDYERCVAISTEAALKEMIAPGALVMLAPIFTGFFFGPEALAGLLAGALVSGVQMAISMSNTGGAWDNAKKYIAAGGLGQDKRKHSPEHNAAVIGDTVGDPMKDTSGPSINILIKLMAIISLVFAPAFKQMGDGLIVKIFK